MLVGKKSLGGIFKSSAGIIASLFIILVFIFIASFLKSVLFGIVLAFFALPIQKWIATVFLKNNIVCGFFNILSNIKKPFAQLANKISNIYKKDSFDPPPSENLVRSNLACHLTLVFFFGAFLLIFTSISWFSANYVYNIYHDVRNFADSSVKKEQNAQVANEQETYFKSLISSVSKDLNKLKPKLEKVPGFALAQKELATYLKDKNNQKSMAVMLLNKSGGVFSFTLGAVGGIIALIINFLLTLFFFSFFLQKMGAFATNQKEKSSIGGYLVNSIFSSKWLPDTEEDTKKSAKEIINHISLQLKSWVRGYILIMIIETIIYTIALSVLNVPYPIALGCIAGCNVLLPFIGPLATGSLTILVCFAVNGGNQDMLQIALIVLLFSFVTGILDQLILYPNIVGESLGLTTLETIIVVLLGGLFIGISGMVLAVPVTAIAKYLIPKIYSQFND